MLTNKYNSIIFGGSGFIGKHLQEQLKSNYLNLDIQLDKNNYQFCDIRKRIDIQIKQHVDVIYNLAAIHTTPGHEYHEYFETNINGAKNICDFARKNNINTIIFTSSIAPYGAWEEEKYENSLPLPTSAYGSSKLVAEEIHKQWQIEKPNQRKLIIVRPGVVFGINEKGNFTRLYNALKSRKFVYPGRKDTKKAAIYVKDLVSLMIKMNENELPGVSTYNTVYSPCHTIENICNVIVKVTDVKKPLFTIPSIILQAIASIIFIINKLLGISFNGIHPDRVKKLMISTNINGEKLLNNGYELQYNLEEAIYDWYKDNNFKYLK